MGLRKKATSGIKWTAVSSFITSGLSFLQLAVLGRLLDPADFGLMAMVMVVIGLAQAYADMGISNAIIHRQDTSRDQLSSLYWLNIFAGIIVFALIVATTPLIVAFYHEPRLKNLLILSAIIFLVTPIGQQFQILLQRELRFNQLAIIEIVSTLIGVGVTILTAFSGQGVYSLIWGQLSTAIVKTLMISTIGLKEWRPHLHFRRNDLEGYLGFGLYQMGERSINYLGWNLDKLFIGVLLGAQSLGYYNIAYQLMVKPFMLFNPIITRVAFPLFAKIQDDNRRLCSGYLDAIRVIALVLFPVYMGMIVLAKPFILLLMGHNWLPAVPVFQILAILGFFYSLGNPLGSLLLAKGRADLGFYLNVFMILLYGAAIWLGGQSGVNGVASALVIATSLVLFPIGFWIRWLLIRMRPSEYVLAFLPMLIAAMIMGGLIHYTNRYMQYNDLFKLSILTGIGSVFYLLIIYIWQGQNFIKLWKDSH